MLDFRPSTYLFFGCFLFFKHPALIYGTMRLEILEMSPMEARRGASVDLTCRCSRDSPGPPLMFSHVIEWRKESRVPFPPLNSTGNMLISEMGVVIAFTAIRDHYLVDFTSDDQHKTNNVSLRINQVTDQDDGRYTCRLVSTTNRIDVIGAGSIDVIILNNATSMELLVDGEDASPKLKLLPGKHAVICTTKGSNPPDSLQLSLNQATLKMGTPTHDLISEQSASAKAPRYRVEQTADISVDLEHTGQTLTCKSSRGSPQISSLLAVVAKPTIWCLNDTLYQGHEWEIACGVRHTDVIIDDVDWVFDEFNTTFSTRHDANGNYSVDIESLTDGESRVTLKLKVTPWPEGSTTFELIVRTDMGQASQTAYIQIAAVEYDAMDDSIDDNYDDNNNGTSQGCALHAVKFTLTLTPVLLLLR